MLWEQLGDHVYRFMSLYPRPVQLNGKGFFDLFEEQSFDLFCSSKSANQTSSPNDQPIPCCEKCVFQKFSRFGCWLHIYGRRKSISWHSSIKKIWNDIVDIFIPTPVLTYIIPLSTGLSMSLRHPQILTQFASRKPAYSCQHATICLMGARWTGTTDRARRIGADRRSQGYEGWHTSHYRSSCCRLRHLRSHLGDEKLREKPPCFNAKMAARSWVGGIGFLFKTKSTKQLNNIKYINIYVFMCDVLDISNCRKRSSIKRTENRTCLVEMSSCAWYCHSTVVTLRSQIH